MAKLFDFFKLEQQSTFIDEGVEQIRKKLINCDIGNGSATNALSLLDNELSEVESKLDFLHDNMQQEVQEMDDKNLEIKRFIEDIDSKIDELENTVRNFRSPQPNQDTPLSNGRTYHPRYYK